jgi:cytochrome c biogenesis factor
MFKTAPEISKVYFVFSSMALAVLIALYVVAGVVKVCRKEANKASATVSLLLIILLLSLYATLICVREFDYRNVLFMVVGWPAAVMALTERRDTL